MKNITIYRPGTEVLINGTIQAWIKTASIQENGITYNVVWWDNLSRQEEWLMECEFEPTNGDDKVEIGFYTNKRMEK
jgi:hypothetical protein